MALCPGLFLEILTHQGLLIRSWEGRYEILLNWSSLTMSLMTVLSDIKSIGSHWSWDSNSLGTRILVRFDRILCNEAWIDMFPESYYIYHHQTTRDHSPLWLHLHSIQWTIAFQVLQLLATMPRFHRPSPTDLEHSYSWPSTLQSHHET